MNLLESIFGSNREAENDYRNFINLAMKKLFQSGGQANSGQYGNIRPASQDPYGDPADSRQYGNIRPASEDPYGDPADQQYR